MLYRHLIGSFALTLSPKRARRLTLYIIRCLCHLPIIRLIVKRPYNHPSLFRSVFGLDLKSPIGLGACLNQDARYFKELSSIGAAFTTVGPLALHPDDNLVGVRDAIARLKSTDSSDERHVIALLAKSKGTLQDDIPDEIDRSYTLLYDFCDIVCIDMDGIRIDIIDEILDRITTIRRFNDDHRAILIKLPVNASDADLDLLIHETLSFGIDGIVIADGIRNHEMLSLIIEKSQGLVPIAISGGVITPQSAKEFLDEGASLLCLTDEIIKEGPFYIKHLCKYIVKNENGVNMHDRR